LILSYQASFTPAFASRQRADKNPHWAFNHSHWRRHLRVRVLPSHAEDVPGLLPPSRDDTLPMHRRFVFTGNRTLGHWTFESLLVSIRAARMRYEPATGDATSHRAPCKSKLLFPDSKASSR
jgi:hypothetical protein